MFEHAQKRELQRMRFEAALHGIDLDKETEQQAGKEAPSFLKFGDPESYKKLPKKEREDLTRKMMAQHKEAMK